MEKCLFIFVLGLLYLKAAECSDREAFSVSGNFQYPAINCRKHTAFLTDFGGKGDGKTSNTAAFREAVANLSKLASDGGAQLVVPPGKWVTGSFNLTSHFTLFIHRDAVLLASQEEYDYPVVDPLPSYGRGIDMPGKKFAAVITGDNLTDVVITGGNGTIDGQGQSWWDKFNSHKLKYSRPILIEILHSNQVQISHLTLINSPAWNVHPVYCKDVIIENLTILAPVEAPNTDGINPDSCTNVRIRDSYVVSSDDCIAIKSGWDQHGIKVGMPSQHISIKRLTCVSPRSAVVALGSEMSGGIQDVRAEEIRAFNTESGVRIKTGRGRGGYVKDIYVKNMLMNTMKYVFWMNGNYDSHPDNGYDPNALPEVKNINFMDFVAENVTIAGDLEGIQGDAFTGICVNNATIGMTKKQSDGKKKKKLPWNCTDVAGISSLVSPKACDLLPEKTGGCAFPEDVLDIDRVELKRCSVEYRT